jgi:hypothetical protein
MTCLVCLGTIVSSYNLNEINIFGISTSSVDNWWILVDINPKILGIWQHQRMVILSLDGNVTNLKMAWP